MAATVISDLAIVPTTFLEYVNKLILQKSALIQSGVMANVPTFIPPKGKTTNAPAYLGFTGVDEVISDTAPLTVNSVGSTNAVSVINFRGKSFGANDMVGILAGQDPLGLLANKYADFWVRNLNAVALNTLAGSALGQEADHAGLIINDQALAVITSDMVLDTLQLMGEYANELTHVVMHSAVRTKLQKLDKLTVGVPGSANSGIETYEGRIVVVDDTNVPAVGVYTTYFCAAGALAYSDGSDPAKFIELDRDILQGDDITTSRKRFIVHPMGTTFDGTPAGVSPTNAELAAVGSWSAEDTAEDKRYPVRVLKHLIA